MNHPSITPKLGTAGIGDMQPAKPVQMREGQMFHGQIKQLYPGQMAEIQIGSQKLNAKLEVPLKAGDSYYFQVKATEPELQLKIVSGPHAQGESQSAKIGSLLDTLQLTKTPEMRKLVDFFMKQQIPITREALMAGETLLKQTSPAQQLEALHSIGKLVSLKLPVTLQLFQAMMGVETKAGLQGVLDNLQTALVADKNISPIQKTEIQSVLHQIKQPLLEMNGEKLFAQTLFTALDKSAPSESRFQAVQLLKSAGILPAQTSLANLPEVLARLVSSSANPIAPTATSNSEQEILQQTPNTTRTGEIGGSVKQQLQGADAKQLLTVLQQAVSGDAKLRPATASQLNRYIQQTGMPATIKAQLTDLITAHSQTNETARGLLTKVSEILFNASARVMLPAQNPTGQNGAPNGPAPASAQSGISPLLQTLLDAQGSGQEKLPALMRQAVQSNAPFAQALLMTAEKAVSEEVTGSTIKQAIQSVLAKLGVHYEADLASKEPQISQIQQALKPQLVALMQEGMAGTALRDAAETIVSRLNGQPLQSVESGAQQQIIMQVPLQLQGKRIDATLEWNGRMKDDGKIDPDHARVLFYLDLERMQKTVVDMQVQNKVVTLTIFNDDPSLKAAGALLHGKLEEGLDAEGYRLSAVRFKQFQEETSVTSKSQLSSKGSSQGVDFRI